jgi:hypothetical protein
MIRMLAEMALWLRMLALALLAYLTHRLIRALWGIPEEVL